MSDDEDESEYEDSHTKRFKQFMKDSEARRLESQEERKRLREESGKWRDEERQFRKELLAELKRHNEFLERLLEKLVH